MKFKFEKDKHGYSGRIAFTGPSTSYSPASATTRCTSSLAASGVQAVQAVQAVQSGSCINPTACGSLVTARGWRWRMLAMAV